MGNFLSLALLAAQAVAAQQSAPPRKGAWCRIAGLASIVLCLLIASGFLLAALWLFLTPLIGAIDTALVIAALVLCKAICIALLLRYGRPVPKAVMPISPLPSLPWADLAAALNTNKAPVLLAALLVGVLAGSGSHARR